MILWRNIENYHFLIILIPTPDFPHFYYMLGANLRSLLYGDVSLMCKFYSRRDLGMSTKCGSDIKQKLEIIGREGGIFVLANVLRLIFEL